MRHSQQYFQHMQHLRNQNLLTSRITMVGSTYNIKKRKQTKSTHPNQNKCIESTRTLNSVDTLYFMCMPYVEFIHILQNQQHEIMFEIYRTHLQYSNQIYGWEHTQHTQTYYISRSGVYHILTCARGVCADLNFVHIFHGRTLESISF